MNRRASGTSQQLARHGLLYTVGIVVQGAATLAILPVATRILSPTEYGLVAVGLSILQIGVVFAVAGLPAAVTRAYFDPGDGPLRARAMLGLIVGLGVLTATAGLALRPVVGLVSSLAIAAVGATALVVGVQSVLRAQGRPLLFVTITIGSTVGAHIVGLGAAALERTAAAYLAGYLAGAALAALLALVAVPPQAPWRVPGASAEGLRIALPVVPHTAAILTLNNADPLIVARLLDASEAGRYQVAMMLGIAPLAVLAGINHAWAPAIMGTRQEDRWEFLARSVQPIMALAAVCTVGLALVAPLAIRILAPAEFGHEELTQLAQLIALCALPQVVYLGASSVMFNEKRTTPLLYTTPFAAALFVGLAIPLVDAFGLLGMTLAKVAGFLALAIATMVAAGRVARVPWQPLRWLPIVAGATSVVLGLQLVPNSLAALWVQAGAAVLLGLALIPRVARLTRPAPAAAET